MGFETGTEEKDNWPVSQCDKKEQDTDKQELTATPAAL